MNILSRLSIQRTSLSKKKVVNAHLCNLYIFIRIIFTSNNALTCMQFYGYGCPGGWWWLHYSNFSQNACCKARIRVDVADNGMLAIDKIADGYIYGLILMDMIGNSRDEYIALRTVTFPWFLNITFFFECPYIIYETLYVLGFKNPTRNGYEMYHCWHYLSSLGKTLRFRSSIFSVLLNPLPRVELATKLLSMLPTRTPM